MRRLRFGAAVGVLVSLLLSAAASSSAAGDGSHRRPHPTPNRQKTEVSEVGISTHNTDDQPTFIKVAIRQNRNPNNPIQSVQRVDFYYYVNHSLPFEWAATSKAAAYEAGALSVKSFAWYYIVSGGAPSPGDAIRNAGADVDNTTNTQAYIDGECDPLDQNSCVTTGSRSAVYQTQGKLLKNGTGPYEAFHLRGTYSDDRATMPNNTISQEGSRFLADPTRSWSRDAILTGYYTNPAVTIADTTPPEIRSFNVSGVTSNSITLSWLNYPGDTSSKIGKYNSSTGLYEWTTVTGASSYTYTGLTPGAYYDFTVQACNIRGCGRRSFDSGWIYASTHWGDTAQQPPTAQVHFITDREVRFTLSKLGATQFQVYKKVNGGQWQGPLSMHSFDEYRETGLAANSYYEYAARAFVSGSWTEYTNGGSFTIKTYPTR